MNIINILINISLTLNLFATFAAFPLMTMRYFTTIFISLSLISSFLNGQVKNESVNSQGNLSLVIKSISFVKNNEYYSPVIEGYTLLGSFFQPVLIYSPSEKVTLGIGGHFLSYSGTGGFSGIRPVFSTKYRISERSLLTLGTLSGSDNHKLFDPHFNSERLYNEYIEDGVQYVFNNSSLFSDTWISWENFIFRNDPEREIFTAGESFRYTSATFGKGFQAEIPVQIQLKHYGGQISNYSEHVETYFNLAAGLKINFYPGGKFPGNTALEYLFFKNKEFTSTNVTGINGGNASWLRLHYYFKWFYAGLAYWKSNNFYAPNGNFIYSSLSDYNITTLIPSRSIITSSLSINLSPESFMDLFLGADIYYDTHRKRFDNSIKLHLNFNKIIRLANIKQ